MGPIIDKFQEVFLHNIHNSNIIYMGDTILAAALEARIGKNWCLLNNKSILNSFINGKYMSNIRDATDGQYLRVHCNVGVTYTNNVGYLLDNQTLSGKTQRR